MESVPPHVARLIRDRTLSSTAELVAEIDAKLLQPPEQLPTMSKSTHYLTNLFYKTAKSKGAAIFKMLLTSRKSAKKNQGIFAEWAVDDGRLVAYAYLVRCFDVQPNFTVVVSRHAIERVSQRLGVIKPQDIRDELATAIAGCYLSYHCREVGEYLASTPHGYAIMVLDEKGWRMPTWISKEQAWASQSELRWQDFKGISSREGKVMIETATGAPVLAIQRKPC